MRKTLLFSAFSLIGLSALAQPTIQSSDFYPSIGENFTIHQADYMSPGPAGNNVTWDLSGLVSNSTATVNILAQDPAYPGSTHNFEFVGQSNVHVNLAPGSYTVKAEVTPNAVIDYSNPYTLYEFPMSVGDMFTDAFVGTIDQGGLIMQRTGSVDVEVDGYGTLITPHGTFSNVLRVHSYRTIEDDFQGTIINSTIDMYQWIQAGSHIELANIQTLTMMGNQATAALYAGGTLSLNDEASVHPLTLYPNPANDIVSLQYDLQIDKVEVIDVNGRSVSAQFNTSNNSIDISNLNAGIYYVTVISNNSKSVQKLLKR